MAREDWLLNSTLDSARHQRILRLVLSVACAVCSGTMALGLGSGRNAVPRLLWLLVLLILLLFLFGLIWAAWRRRRRVRRGHGGGSTVAGV
jgi:hypothetical protein